jgi:chromosome partitioning protein
MKNVIAMVNNKGGVGKTLLTINLASVFANDHKVLIIDNDQQNNIATSLLDYKLEEVEAGKTVADAYAGQDVDIIKMYPDEHGMGVGKELYLLPSNREKMKQLDRVITNKKQYYTLLKNNALLQEHIKEFDLVIIDCPPALNAFAMNALNIAGGVIIPVIPGKNELIGISNLFTAINDIAKENGHKVDILGAVINQFESNRSVPAEFVEEMEKIFSEEQIFQTVICRSSAYSKATWDGYPVDLQLRKEQKHVKDFFDLKDEVIKKLNKK